MIQALQTSIKSYYDLSLELKSLDGELDLNYLGTSDNGQKYIIKLMRENCSTSLIDLQTATLLHLAKHSLPIDLPKVILTKEDTSYTYFQDRILWVLSYCKGILLADY